MTTERELTLLDPHALRLLEMYRKGQHGVLLHEVDELAKQGLLSPAVLGMASLGCAALERYDEAATAARNALEQQPGWAWLHHALAAAAAGAGQREPAILAETRATQLAPGEPAYAAALARYLREAGRPAEAVRVARQALLNSPDDAGVLNELGLALLEHGDPAGALAPLRQAQAAAPYDPAGFISEGVVHLRGGDRSQARRSFSEALRRQPGLELAEDRMADTLASPPGLLRQALGHMMTLSRVTSLGWAIIAFLYYVGFRILQIVWRLVPALLPAGQALLLLTLLWLGGGLLMGWSLRLAFRAGWPR